MAGPEQSGLPAGSAAPVTGRAPVSPSSPCAVAKLFAAGEVVSLRSAPPYLREHPMIRCRSQRLPSAMAVVFAPTDCSAATTRPVLLASGVPPKLYGQAAVRRASSAPSMRACAARVAARRSPVACSAIAARAVELVSGPVKAAGSLGAHGTEVSSR